MKQFFIYGILSFVCLKMSAQNINMAVADTYSSDSLSSLMLNYDISVTWINNDSKAFYYSTKDAGGFTYFCFDVKRKHLKKVFDSYELERKMEPLGIVSSKEKHSSFQENRISQLDFDPEKLTFCEFNYGDSRFRYNLKNKQLTKVEKKEEEKNSKYPPKNANQWWKSYSADSLFYITSYNHNLYLHGANVKDSIQLTHDGERYYSYAVTGNSDRLSSDSLLLSKPVGQWIGNSHYFFLAREDKRNVETMTVVNSLSSPRPTTRSCKFSIPGDKNVIQYDVHLINADEGKIYKVEIDKYVDQKIEIPRFSSFAQTNKEVYFIRRPRTNDKIELCKLDINTLTTKTVIEEDCMPHLNEQLFNYHLINSGKEILWWSERSGKGAYYLYDDEGNLKNSITDGSFVAGQVTIIDTLKRTFIFEGYGREQGINPYYKHFYKTDFKGTRLTLLTPGNGEHCISFSPDGKYITDHYSRMDMAPRHVVRNMNGELIAELGVCNLSGLYKKGWREPEILQLFAADSITPLYGIVYLPFEVDSTKKYPIISNVYPGPHMDLIPQTFSLDDNYNQSLAQLGFIVVNFAGRGSSPVRGRDFYNFGFGNLRDYPLADDKAVIRQIAKEYVFADISRVGIYGHSGGGFMAATAMMSDPDFYKVAIAASGNYDNNIYTQWWGETFHGVKQIENKDKTVSFECNIPTTTQLANNLKGRLFLITGDVDINVHPANTLRLANALIKANKRFDMMIIPGADHGLGNKYYINMIRYYFVENLLGIKLNHIDISINLKLV